MAMVPAGDSPPPPLLLLAAAVWDAPVEELIRDVEEPTSGVLTRVTTTVEATGLDPSLAGTLTIEVMTCVEGGAEGAVVVEVVVGGCSVVVVGGVVVGVVVVGGNCVVVSGVDVGGRDVVVTGGVVVSGSEP